MPYDSGSNCYKINWHPSHEPDLLCALVTLIASLASGKGCVANSLMVFAIILVQNIGLNQVKQEVA